MFRLLILFVFAGLTWLLYAWTQGLTLFESSFLPPVLRIVATTMTAAFSVLTGASLVLDLGLRRGLGIEPNGAQRVVVFAVLTFVSSALAMKFLGSDIAGILTTSALLTAIVGFALQPTLGGLFAGVALQLDRHLQPGSGIIYEGLDTRIESMNWRSIVGRRRDHTRVIIPNAKLASEAVAIYPDDRAVRRDTFFYAPVSIPPQRVAKLVRELVSDLSYVENTSPVMVAPVEQLPELAALKYRVRYRIAYYFEIPEVEGEVFRRIWYGFQRHDIPLPVTRLYGSELRDRQTGELGYPEGYDLDNALAQAIELGATFNSRDRASLRQSIESDGRVLLYGPSERIVIPSRWAGRRYLLAAGELTQDDPDFGDRRRYGAFPEVGARRLFVHKVAESARIRQIADRLAQDIGPYAEQALSDAALKAESFEELCALSADLINDDAAREAFLADMSPRSSHRVGPGLVFDATRDVAGHIVSSPHYRAVDEAVIIALPAGCETSGQP